MADKSRKVPRRIKKTVTVREKAQAKPDAVKNQGKLRKTARRLLSPAKSARKTGKKEYYLPLPDNKAGRFLNKRRSIFPSYFKNSLIELKQVAWPSRKQTFQLTLAVFIFAIIFGVIISVTDYGLGRIFKRLLVE